MPTIGTGEAVTVVVVRSQDSGGELDITNESLGNGVAGGGGGGAVAGGAWGLTCGPLAVLCVPLGAMIGGVTGGVAGGVVGVTGMLPDEKAKKLRDRVSGATQAHSLVAEINDGVTTRALKYWKVDGAQPSTRVTIHVHDPRLMATRDEQIRCAIQLTVFVERPGTGSRAERSFTKQYQYLGPYGALAVWLDQGSDFVDTSLTSASQQFAAQIVSDLAPH